MINFLEENIRIIQCLDDHKEKLQSEMGIDWSRARWQFWQKLVTYIQSTGEPPLEEAIDDLVQEILESEAAGFLRKLLKEQFLSHRHYRSGPEDPDNKEPSTLLATVGELVKACYALLDDLIGVISKPPEGERTINAWIPDPLLSSPLTLGLGVRYRLHFMVGDSRSDSLLAGEGASLPGSDIPAEGLWTEWVIASDDVAINGQYRDVRIELLIPPKGNSELLQLDIVPMRRGLAVLDVLIYSDRELYRQFQVKVLVVEDLGAVRQVDEGPGSSELNLVVNDQVFVLASQLNISSHRPRIARTRELQVVVMGQHAHVSGDRGDQWEHTMVPWTATPAVVAGPIANVLASAEKFRGRWDGYLNDLDGPEFDARLAAFPAIAEGPPWVYQGDERHEKNWAAAAVSAELRALAYDGYVLYDSFWPAGTEIRAIMDSLSPGQRIQISWTPASGPGYIPHVPWGFLYPQPPPGPGEPVDGAAFWGLRFRIGYVSHAVQAASKWLGRVEDSSSLHLLYREAPLPDEISIEASWQEERMDGAGRQSFVPQRKPDNAREEIMAALDNPDESPLSLLYLYCLCSVGEGNNPVLRFGSGTQGTELVTRTDLGSKLLPGRPLVFANACSTAGAGPYIANELENIFFRRGCKAYLGTETKVPVLLASRYAHLFLSYFYRRIDPRPIAAGEAVSQARWWLWRHYRNIGGLFYSYINQYELYMADIQEEDAL